MHLLAVIVNMHSQLKFVSLLGKSTLLQAISVGHYDKILGDGRELCVSIVDAVTVRAEDGRYVNNWYVRNLDDTFLLNVYNLPHVGKPVKTKDIVFFRK